MASMDELLHKINTMWSGSALSGILDKVKDAEGVDQDAIKDSLAAVFAAADARLQDGFQLTDIIPILSAALHDIMAVAEGLKGATGAEKLEFVTTMFSGLYNFIDKGIDGTKNRIDIPYIPQIAEDFIEKKVLPIAIRFAVETAVSVWNKNRD